jgi:uncharacterized membrane protein YhaH (DUF805 family)
MAARPTAVGSFLTLWFGFEARVDRRAYVLSGLALMAAKYLIDAIVAWLATGAWWAPWRYLCPLWSVRMAQFDRAPGLLYLALAALTLPFFWIGLSMSVRRAMDAGRSPVLGLGFAVPGLNFIIMLALAVARSAPRTTAFDESPPTSDERPVLRSALAAMAATAVALLMVALAARGGIAYAFTLFFITPLAMGVIAGYLVNSPVPRSLGAALAAAVLSAVLAAGVLLLSALEGIVCIAMAAPLALVIVIIGGAIGRFLALHGRPATASLLLALGIMPLLGFAETAIETPLVHEVVTAVDIAAPPDVVWTHVVGFADLPPPGDWVFRTGIAYPIRARISGSGVGAIRRCEFSTGAFVEPITAWEPGRRLAFDVRSQPPPMQEWSFYAAVHPAHLDSLLRSRRGEFRLIPLPDGATRLEGHTWYELSASPTMYWRVWSDAIIHRIHERVLAHVQRLSEGER